MENYKKIMFISLMLITMSIAVSSVSADDIWIHTYGSGSAFKPAHWTSPNGFVFKDKAWSLAFIAYYQISFFDKNGNEISYVKDHMYAWTSDNKVSIPDNAVTMDIYLANSFFSKNLKSCLMYKKIKACDGAMAFDGNDMGRNFHLKTKDHDFGYTYFNRPFKGVGQVMDVDKKVDLAITKVQKVKSSLKNQKIAYKVTIQNNGNLKSGKTTLALWHIRGKFKTKTKIVNVKSLRPGQKVTLNVKYYSDNKKHKLCHSQYFVVNPSKNIKETTYKNNEKILHT